MKLKIIKDDNLVTIDGISKKIDLSSLLDIHAVTFDSTLDTGFIEYVNNFKVNKTISGIDISELFQVYIDKWSNNELLVDVKPDIPAYIPTLEELKAIKLDAINARRDVELNKGFIFNAVAFDSDPTARGNVTAQLTAINSGLVTGTLYWRAKNNTNVMFTPQEFTALAGTMLSFVELQYQKSWQLKDAVYTAITKEEVDNLLWV